MKRLARAASLLGILPRARNWVIGTVSDHASRARPLSDFAFDRLPALFPESLLSLVRIVVIDQVPRPPLESWNLHGADDFAGFQASGITLARTIFIKAGCESDESLFFHEMVHIVQWEFLGMNRFLGVYGLQLLEHGYADSPLESMAYSLQRQFDHGRIGHDVQPVIHRRTQEEYAKFVRTSAMHRVVGIVLSIAPGRLIH